ncbi:MAG: TolC family protein, partial [Candidatus Zixiibacteriota bacterium]
DPVLSVGFLNLPHGSLSFDETPMSGIAVGWSQALPWPGKLSAQNSLAHLESDFQNLQEEAFRNSIVRQVRESYYEYSYQMLADSVLGQSLGLLDDLIGAVETRYANGFGTARDLLRAQTTRSRLENRRRQVQQQAWAALLQLTWLTDDPDLTKQTLPPYLILDISSEAITSMALEKNNPSLAGMAVRTGVAQTQEALARADYWPDFTVGVDYILRRDIPGDPVRGEDYLTFKIGLRLPLWFSKQRNNSQAAFQNVQTSKEKERAFASRLERMISNKTGQLRTTRQSYLQYEREILPQAKAAYEAAMTAYEVGQVDYNTLISAQLELLDIELERLSLLKDYHTTLAVLLELTGERYER